MSICIASWESASCLSSRTESVMKNIPGVTSYYFLIHFHEISAGESDSASNGAGELNTKHRCRWGGGVIIHPHHLNSS